MRDWMIPLVLCVVGYGAFKFARAASGRVWIGCIVALAAVTALAAIAKVGRSAARSPQVRARLQEAGAKIKSMAAAKRGHRAPVSAVPQLTDAIRAAIPQPPRAPAQESDPGEPDVDQPTPPEAPTLPVATGGEAAAMEQVVELLLAMDDGKFGPGVSVSVSDGPRASRGRSPLRRPWWNPGGLIGTGVVGGLLYVGYLLLDASTRGHFTWQLRIVGLLAFVGTCLTAAFLM
ncbi:MAG: hypothetical protein HY763_07150 [Planctomycetes bacterium]|nr:hypothetical protein [Planctomycetota bacterium]